MQKNRARKLNKTQSFTNGTIANMSYKNIYNAQNIKGNLLSYGCLNLTLTIELTENDFNKNEVKWENIKNYNMLSFIIKDTSLWPRIKLSSTNNTLHTLLHMNRILENKIKIKHISFRKIKFVENLTAFQDLLKTVTNSNGLYLDSHSICPCELSVQLRLRYNGRRRLFVLCGEKTPLDDDDDEEGDYDMKEDDNILLEEGTNYDLIPGWENMNGGYECFDIDSKKDDEEYNPFIDIPKEINNLQEFSYIYFNFEDYNGNENNTFKGKITLKYLYNYFIYIRKNFKNNKTVLNMGFGTSEIGLEVRDLLSITSIVIFYEKNKLFQILNNFRNEEEKIKREKEYFKHYYDNKIKKEEIQKYLDEEEKRANFIKYLQRRASEKNILENKKYNSLEQDENLNFLPLFLNKTRYSKNIYSIKLATQRLNSNKKIQSKNKEKKEEEKKIIIKDNKYFIPLTKAEMFNYYKKEVCEKDLLIKPGEEKMLIVLDELNKLYIVQFNKQYEKPFVLDLGLKLYDQINVHNINRIKPYKELIKENIEEYTILYIGYLLSSLVNYTSNENKVSEEAALFIGYYGGQKILKKIIQMEKNEIDVPEKDNFFMPNLTKEEIDNLINQAERRKKEIKFILDGNNKNAVKLQLYNPLLDKYATSYINNNKNKHYLKHCGFITDQGRLLYDPVYRESLLVNRNEKKIRNEKDLIKTCHEIKEKNDFKMKENDCLNNYKNINEQLNKFMVGFKQKKPEYDIYLKQSTNKKLPIIKNNMTSNNNISSNFNSPFKTKSSGNFKMKSVKKRLNIHI